MLVWPFQLSDMCLSTMFFDRFETSTHFALLISNQPLINVFYRKSVFFFIIPLLRHFTIFGQENAQNMSQTVIHCSVPV